MKRGNERLRTTTEEDRGVSPQVGLIILFGMVAVGVVLVLVIGTGLIDSLESESRAEQTRATMDLMDHGFSTVVGTGEDQEVPFEDAQFDKDGTAYIAWVNNSSNAWDNKPNVTIEPLGAVESETNDRTIAYQGGGIWEQTADGTSVYSSPNVRYDQETNSLTVDLVQITASDVRGNDAVAELDLQQSSELATQIEKASKQSNGTDFALRIESEYHEGWNQYLRSAMGADNVDHDPSERRVDVYIENARSTAVFEVTDVEADRVVPRNGELTANVSVRNVGDTYGTGNVTVAVNPEDDVEVGLKPGEETTETVTVSLANISRNKSNLSQYGTYRYNASTSDDHLEGEFFLSYPNTSYYKLDPGKTNVVKDVENDTIDFEAGFVNIGETDEERNATITLESDQDVLYDGDTIDLSWESNSVIQQQPWNESTLTTSINRSALPDGEYELTVSIDNPACDSSGNGKACERTRTFTVEGSEIGDPGSVIITEPANVSTSVIGTEISAEGPGTSRVKPTPDATVVIDGADQTDGSMIKQGSGDFGFSLVPSEPDSANDVPETSSRGGWVAADGTEPEARIEQDCIGMGICWTTDSYWEWDVDELVWSEDGGYELDWSRGGDWSWQGNGSAEVVEFDRYKRWAPVTASVTVGDSEMQLTPTDEDNTVPVNAVDENSMEEHNLNTFGTQEAVWNYEEENVTGTVTINSTYWSCNRWEYAGTDKSAASGSLSDYYHLECTDFGSPITTAEGGGDTVDSDGGFVMTRDTDRNNLPDIEEGYPRQRNVNEVFTDGTSDIELGEDGNLTLGPRDFAFMMEVTMDQEGLQETYGDDYDGDYDLYSDDQSELFLAAWDIAKNYRDEADETNDPNYNDVIGFVQIDGGGTYVDLEDNPFGPILLDGESLAANIVGGGSIDFEDESGTISVDAGSITIR